MKGRKVEYMTVMFEIKGSDLSMYSGHRWERGGIGLIEVQNS